MIIARFEFKPEHAASFIRGGGDGQNIIEVAFESVESLIETTKEFEEVLVDCTAVIGDKIISVAALSAK